MADSLKTTTSLGNWDFGTQHVQQNLNGGDFINSQSCIICATAPRAEMLAGVNESNMAEEAAASENTSKPAYAIPIGIVSDFGLQQQKQMAKIYEIGSARSYTVSSGRTDIGLQLNRVIFRGPNLLAVLMAYYPDKGKAMVEARSISDKDKATGLELDHGIQLNSNLPYVQNLPEIHLSPGYNNFWINLASNLFSQPLGLLFVMQDQNKRPTASIFLEDCYIQSHQFSVTSASAILAESVSITADRIVPQKVNIIQKFS